jgi:putative transposase
MLANKSYQVRIYPNKLQSQQLKSMTGACRWLWNYLLELNIAEYEGNGKFIFFNDMSKLLPQLKNQYPWLSEIPSNSLERVCKNLDKALCNSFKGKNRKGFPKFKKKTYTTGSMYLHNQKFHLIDDRYVKLPKIKQPIKYKTRKLPEGKILSGTVSQEGNHWYISITCEQEMPDLILTPDYNTTIGIDMGLSNLLTLSNGETIQNHRYLKKSEKKLKRRQRQLAKSRKGSNNRKKRQLEVYKIHRKIRNQRKDHLHKIKTDMITKYSVICIEDLNISGMMKNHKLSKSISDASWHELMRQLTYKAQWNGRHLVKIGRYEASTKTCSICGHKKDLSLSDRTYDCNNCGLILDRDINAAINIKDWGYKKLIGVVSPEYTPVEIPITGLLSQDIASYVSLKQEYSKTEEFYYNFIEGIT